MSITGGVRIRKKIADIVPDVAVTGVVAQRLLIPFMPGAKATQRQLKSG
jgi:hypothetical protein